jgi:hypothetical protein
MVHNCSVFASFARRTSVAILLVLALSTLAVAQDPTGRPDPKKKPTTPKKQPTTKPEPVAPTVTLTILSTPPGSTVLVNGEDRGVTNTEGKLQFEKLPLGHYSVEVRKDGYNAMLKGFDAGTESPTLVFKLEPKLDDYIREFNGLIASGKLAGPSSPNAYELLEKLTATYGDRAEVTTLKSVLAAKLGETITPTINQTVTNSKGVTREQLTAAQDAAANALMLNKEDGRILAQAAYLRGFIGLRAWQSNPRTDAGGDGSGNATGPVAARNEFEYALKLDDSFVAARYQLGIALLASSDAAGAEAALVRATQQEPKWAPAYTALGSAYHSGGKYKEAIDAYQKAIALDPNNATAIAGLGLSRVMKGEKDGIKDIERAVKLDSNNALAHFNLGITYSQSKNKKDWSKAEDEFKKAIQLNTQNVDFQNTAAEKMLADVQKRKK